MIVTTREGIVPLCDKHRSPMRPYRYEGGSFGMNAFSCTDQGCTRAYNTSSGYLDVVDGRILLQKEQQLCPEDDTAMFLESLAPSNNGTVEMWRCGQKNCTRIVAVRP
jgi:hypothetical protein